MKHSVLFKLAIVFLLSGICLASNGAFASSEFGEKKATSPALKKVDVEERLGETLDGDLLFTDHEGKSVKISDYFGDKPVLLTLNYYQCETLCSVQLNGLLSGLKELDWTAGDQFKIVTVSIDPTENAAVAYGKRKAYLEELGRGEVEWHFLTGQEADIKRLAEAIGFKYAYDPVAQQYAHPAVITFLSPDGLIARYIYGIQFNARDIKFSLIDAAKGKVGNLMEKMIMSCFSYDHTLGKYTATAFGIMRIGGLLSMFAIGAFSFIMWRRELTTRSRSTT